MSIKENSRLINLLLAEDSLSDLELFDAHMEMNNVQFNFNSVRDGDEAVEFIGKKGKYSEALKPDIIFLDLNLPKKTGVEILKHIKESSAIQDIPVVMLSGSDRETDISSSMENGALEYITKPLSYDKLKMVVAKIPSIEFIKQNDTVKLCVAQ